MTPTIGRIVHYTLSAQDAALINNGVAALAVPKNTAREGDTYPAMIVRVWDGGLVQLQVFYDGAGAHWATSRSQGDGPGAWAWPTRVGS